MWPKVAVNVTDYKFFELKRSILEISFLKTKWDKMETTFNTISIPKLVLTIYCNIKGGVSIVVFISSLQKREKKNPIYITYTMPVKLK